MSPPVKLPTPPFTLKPFATAAQPAPDLMAPGLFTLLYGCDAGKPMNCELIVSLCASVGLAPETSKPSNAPCAALPAAFIIDTRAAVLVALTMAG